mmetsp:Transcript_50361/g.114312  ORF Transcript_50361/g.114312 Transcript_50361/m.114312 type:complete len:204 (-) Transcript_50361:172-783(-)
MRQSFKTLSAVAAPPFSFDTALSATALLSVISTWRSLTSKPGPPRPANSSLVERVAVYLRAPLKSQEVLWAAWTTASMGGFTSSTRFTLPVWRKKRQSPRSFFLCRHASRATWKGLKIWTKSLTRSGGASLRKVDESTRERYCTKAMAVACGAGRWREHSDEAPSKMVVHLKACSKWATTLEARWKGNCRSTMWAFTSAIFSR